MMTRWLMRCGCVLIGFNMGAAQRRFGWSYGFTILLTLAAMVTWISFVLIESYLARSREQ
jgi:hypothetical protein